MCDVFTVNAQVFPDFDLFEEVVPRDWRRL
jgi:hypothetical protein